MYACSKISFIAIIKFKYNLGLLRVRLQYGLRQLYDAIVMFSVETPHAGRQQLDFYILHLNPSEYETRKLGAHHAHNGRE